MGIDDKLAEVFDLPAETKQGEVITADNKVVTPVHDKTAEKIDYDYEKTRNNLHSLLAQGQEALYHALEIAKSSEHPRAFEVVGNLMKQLSEINTQLLDLHQQKQKLDAGSGEKEKDQTPQNVTNNAIFVGSTSELSNMLKNMNKGEN